MKAPKGFGKRYFSFASIQAYSVQITLNTIDTQYRNFLHKTFIQEETLKEDPPEDLLLAPLQIINSKPCHCNCLFKYRSLLAIHLFKFIPRCPYYDTFFAFRRTGVHPPIF